MKATKLKLVKVTTENKNDIILCELKDSKGIIKYFSTKFEHAKGIHSSAFTGNILVETDLENYDFEILDSKTFDEFDVFLCEFKVPNGYKYELHSLVQARVFERFTGNILIQK